MPSFEHIMQSTADALSSIWLHPFNLVKFWCIKYAENPEKAREVDKEKNSYDRQDNYDG